MRVLLLLAAVAVVLLGAGVFLLRAAPPAAPPGPGPETFEVVPIVPEGEAPAKTAPPPKPPADPSAQPRLPMPDSVPRRAPQPMPEGGAGEILRPDLPAADREKVDALKLRLMEARLGEVDFRNQGLRRVLDHFAAKTSVPFEIEGEGLDDEPVVCKDPGDNVLEIVRRITMDRHLRFEVTAEKVIVRR